MPRITTEQETQIILIITNLILIYFRILVSCVCSKHDISNYMDNCNHVGCDCLELDNLFLLLKNLMIFLILVFCYIEILVVCKYKKVEL